jgi:hypothetical protein
MDRSFKRATWNTNALAKHSQEIKTFIFSQNVNILLVSETHFTNKSYFRLNTHCITQCTLTIKPIEELLLSYIRSNVKHYGIDKYQREFLQPISIVVEDWITISVIYSPPKHLIKNEQYINLFQTSR